MNIFLKILQAIAIGLAVGALFYLIFGSVWTATKIGLGAAGVGIAYFLKGR